MCLVFIVKCIVPLNVGQVYKKINKYINMGGLPLMAIPATKWEFLSFIMSTLWIIEQHLKSFDDFI